MATRIQRSLLPAILALVFLSAHGEEDAAKRIGIVFEGAFENHPVSRKPPGAENTLMVPFYEWDYGIRPYPEKEWEAEELSWDRILEVSKSLGDGIVERVEPEIIRDTRGVAVYAIFASKDPFLTSAVFSEKFREKFAETMGKSLYLLMIDRHVIYVFPAVGGALEEFGPGLVNEFRTTELPVSLEVFFLNDDGLRVIGELSRDGSSI